MRTYRKRYGGKRLRSKKQRSKKQKSKKQRSKKQRTRRYRRGGTHGTELSTWGSNQPSVECMKLQKALANQEAAISAYPQDYNEWWDEYTEAKYYGHPTPTEPKKPSAVTAAQIKAVQKACGRHFVQNI